MRTFHKQHIKSFINSKFASKQYKNMSADELEKRQHVDENLKLELAFTSMLKRVKELQIRNIKNFGKESIVKQKEDIVNYVYDVKKRNAPRALPTIEEPQDIETDKSKNYNNLFRDTINEDEWTKAELVIRKQYLDDLERTKARQGTCTSCTKNALIRKYVKKIQDLTESNILK